MRDVNKVVLSCLIVLALCCLLACCLFLKPALNGARKFFASFEHPLVQATQTTSLPPQRRADPYAQESQIPVTSKQDILESEDDTGVRPTVALSGLSKAEVYKLRKEAVAASAFAREDYEPSVEVFGGIESYKPWIAATACSDPNANGFDTKGPSEESRFINNPTALVAIEMPVIFGEKASWCTRDDTNMIMQKITHDDFNREVSVTYFNLPFKARSQAFYAFNGINARDLGYPYMYVDMQRSTYKPTFTHDNNVSNQVAQLQNYIHVGSSCRVWGGCNNGSPRQTLLEFREDPIDSTQDREIYIKLWKEKPASVEDEPDMVERIIIMGQPEQTNH